MTSYRIEAQVSPAHSFALTDRGYHHVPAPKDAWCRIVPETEVRDEFAFLDTLQPESRRAVRIRVGNHCRAYEMPTCPCPYCGDICEADWVDVGVGMVQCGPYFCWTCKASEIGPADKPRPLTDIERRYNWYAPGEPLGSSVNTVDGVYVDHKTALGAYREARLDINSEVAHG